MGSERQKNLELVGCHSAKIDPEITVPEINASRVVTESNLVTSGIVSCPCFLMVTATNAPEIPEEITERIVDRFLEASTPEIATTVRMARSPTKQIRYRTAVISGKTIRIVVRIVFVMTRAAATIGIIFIAAAFFTTVMTIAATAV